MNNSYVIILESWKLSYRNEILADIQHSLNGLFPDTILKSKESGYRWKVISRIIFTQVKDQKRFKGEKEYFQRYTFERPLDENLERFQKDIADKESKGIYHYAIEPIGHDNKPNPGEVLQVEPGSL